MGHIPGRRRDEGGGLRATRGGRRTANGGSPPASATLPAGRAIGTLFISDPDYPRRSRRDVRSYLILELGGTP